MVPTLYSSEKLNVGRTSNLAFFGAGLASLASNLATDITLEGRKLVLPGVAKMTLMVPKGGLSEPLIVTGLVTRWVDTGTVATFPP